MTIAVTGSIATDHLMHYPGRFTDYLLSDELSSISLSFLVDDLDVRHGGVAADIAFGLGLLNEPALLVGAAGSDFTEYDGWLTDHGVDTSHVRIVPDKHTARFMCTTDDEQNQIGSFYPGAMAEAAKIELQAVSESTGGFDLVMISPNDPQAMLAHTRECRTHGYKFAADPSQQLASLDGEQVRELVDGAEFLFSNEYETRLLENSTGWSEQDVLSRVCYWVRTYGADGVEIRSNDSEPIAVPAVPVENEVDPTGVGDGFRAGFLWGLQSGLSLERSAQAGCTLASYVLGASGPQEYEFDPQGFGERIKGAYGQDAAQEITAHLK